MARVLPAARRQLLDESVVELGDPDAWHERLFPREFSPLLSADFSSRPMDDIVALLRSWKPSSEPVRQTITALGEELRKAVEHEPARFAESANKFADIRPIYIRRMLEGFDTKAKNNEDLTWDHLLDLMRAVIEHLKQPANALPVADGDDKDWLWCCGAAAALLKSGLRRDSNGIPLEHADRVKDIILVLFNLAPRKPTSNDFEDTYSRFPYFAAEHSLWGSSIELSVLFIHWMATQAGSFVASEPRAAFRLLPDMTIILERALLDKTEWGRIPRAILGRHLNLLGYYGEGWLRAHLAFIFPDESDMLRRAAWLGHLMSDYRPAISLMPRLTKSYMDEIDRLEQHEGKQDHEARGNRLGDYLLVHYLADAAPMSVMEAFWQKASVRLRQHVMGFLGRELQLRSGQDVGGVESKSAFVLERTFVCCHLVAESR